MLKIDNYTDDELINVAKCSSSLNDVLRRLNLNAGGTSNRKILKRLLTLGIDPRNRGSRNQSRKHSQRLFETKDIIEGKHPTFQTGKLKHRLLQEGILIYRCVMCGLGDTWQSKKIVLELDHIDGCRWNHNLANLRILCPNCHSQTPTFRNKKRT